MRTLHAILPAAVFGCLLTAPAALAAAGDSESKTINLSDSAAGSAKTATASSSGSIVRTIIGLAVVLGVIYGLHWVLKNVKSSKEATAAGEGLEQLATLPLGANKSLHLVRAGREIVLLGTAEQAIAPIRRYSEAEARTLGLIDTPETVDVPMHATLASLEAAEQPKGFLNALRSKTVVK
jgi:flagellar protein FliO/FliZ